MTDVNGNQKTAFVAAPDGQKGESEGESEGDAIDAGVSFAIVGIGASAGGLEAFKQLFQALPEQTGMAFVLVQHLAPTHPSALAEILSRETKMPVAEVQGEAEVLPNHVYVIPPDRSMVIAGGMLQLLPRQPGVHRPVDQFFRSLAKEQGERAIGVVLSGTATDGTLGLEAIKAAGGITFVQNASAEHEGMPHSAIAAGCVDFVLPPKEIAQELIRIGQHPRATPELQTEQLVDRQYLAQVVQVLLNATGVNFTGYKFNTLYRRVTRRMVFQKKESLVQYVEYLRQTPAEVDALYQDILISVTSFFRDKESFEALKTTVFPRLLKDRARSDPVRLWTLGCSTGQEAYSLAMAFTEAAEAAGSSAPLQLFASDLNAAGIEKARAGVYPMDIAQDVSPERLRRFFTEVDGSYRISKSIRESCVFSRHNVLADPPFSRIDLISCRNLLIYMEPELQRQIMPTLHYALKPAGCLWLGGSETIGPFRNLFEAEDVKHKIYARKPNAGPERGLFPLQHGAAPRPPFVPMTARLGEGVDLNREADRLLSAKFAPPGVLVSADLDILQYRGDTGPFLAPAPGKASLSLLKMLREGLLVGVRAAVLRAGKDGIPMKEAGLRVKSGGGWIEVCVEVIPIKGGGKDGGFLVLFDDGRGGRPPSAAGEEADEMARQVLSMSGALGSLTAPWLDTDHAHLTQELAATREFLQSVIEQQEAANEELQSANEEVQSANEELQSTNEELETSKEEIQSSNEELATVNDELNNRNAELDRVNNDLVNLLGSVQMAIVMVGPDLRVRRFTPTAGKLLNLIPTDVGRPLADIQLNLHRLTDLESLMGEVLDTVSAREREVQDKRGCWYSLRLRPYRTLDNKIDGVVVMLVDVDAMKRAHAYTESIVATVREPLLVLDKNLCVQTASRSFYETFRVTPDGTENRGLFELGNGQWDIPELRRLLEEVVPRDNQVNDFEVEHEFEHIGKRTMMLNARRLMQATDQAPLILLAIEDVSQSNAAQAALRDSHARFEAVFDTSPVGMYLVDSDMRIRQMSRKARPVFGDIGELIGRDFSEVVHAVWPPASASDIVARFRRTLETGESYTVPEFSEERFDRKVREYYDWQIHRLTLPDSQNGVVCYFSDISARVMAEQSVRESERRQRLVLDSMPQKIVTAKPDGEMNYFSPQWMEFTGLSFEQLKGWGWKQVVHPDDLAETDRLWQRSIDTGEPFVLEHRLRDAQGLYRWHLTRNMTVRDAEGKVVLWIGSCTETHEQRQTTNQLQLLAADLSEADRRKNEFLAMLAHELRNPLAPIRNELQILRRLNGGGEAVQAAYEMMERQTNQMVRLVDDLLDVSRSSRGKIALREERVDLASVVNSAVEAVRPACLAKELELTVILPAERIGLTADPARLVQVVGNLLNNASKFTDQGGHIQLVIAREAGLAVIRVRDNGIGIAADQLSRIFDMFVQVDTSLERSVSGLGIGLTLAKSLVEMHGGTLAVFSAGVGCGSEFVVHLPIGPETSDSPLPSLAIDAVPLALGRRILVVDDNVDAASTLAELLTMAGHTTQTAVDGLEAVDKAKAFQPDVVLLDIGLPKLNGYDACRQIRALPRGRSMTIVALTGWGLEEDRKESRDAGFDGHFVKPVEYEALMKLLDGLLHEKKHGLEQGKTA